MSYRYIENIIVDGTSYDLMTFSDMSFVENLSTTLTQVSISGTIVRNTNMFDIGSPVSVETYYDTNYSNLKFRRRLKNSNQNVAFAVMNGSTVVVDIGGTYLPTQTDLNFGIVLNDDNRKGYFVLSSNEDGSRHYYGLYNSSIYETIVPPSIGGGAGSGYIGNSLLSNKKMVGYNVPTSSAESTKTESVSQASATPMPNVPKIGNGFARIKLVSEQQTKSFFNVVSSYDLSNVGGGTTADSIDYSNYLGRIVFYGQSNRKLLSINDGVFNYTSALSYTQSNLAFPLKDYPIRITKVTCKVTLKELRGSNSWVDLKIICNSGRIGRAKYAFTDPDPVNINVGEETSFTFDVSSSNMQATHLDLQFSYGIWEVKEIMVSYV